MEIAVVGPEIRCRDDPNRAAIIGVTMAVYRPYWGGSPAMVANATPCGSTITAPVRPAMKSARSDARLMSGNQARNGRKVLIARLFMSRNYHAWRWTLSGAPAGFSGVVWDQPHYKFASSGLATRNHSAGPVIGYAL